MTGLSGVAAGSVILVTMALGMGFRHGLDPDHLTAIDAILRFQSVRKRRVVRWSGLFFWLFRKICCSNRGQEDCQVNDRVRFLES